MATGSALAVALTPGLAGAKEAPATLQTTGRWPTGNRRPAPFAVHGDLLLATGDGTAEAWQLPLSGKQEPLWRHSLPAGMVSAFRPRTGGDTVVCGGREAIAAWRTTDGKALWTHAGAAELGVPFVDDGHVYVGEGNSLIALDPAGKTVWRFGTGHGTKVAYAANIFDGTILLAPGDGMLYGLRPSDGKLLWTIDRHEEWQYLRQLHLSGDTLVGGGYHDEVYGLSAKDGSARWKFVAGNFVNSHLVAGDSVYLWSPTGFIYALNAETGNVRWRHRTVEYFKTRTSNWAPMLAELVVDGGSLLCLAMDDVLHVLDRAKGDETLRIKAPERVRPFIIPRPEGYIFSGLDGAIIATTKG